MVTYSRFPVYYQHLQIFVFLSEFNLADINYIQLGNADTDLKHSRNIAFFDFEGINSIEFMNCI